MPVDSIEPGHALAFKSWLFANGGHMYEGVRYQANASGSSIIARQDVPPDTTIVSCPFSLAITPQSSMQALCLLFDTDVTAFSSQSWSERQLIGSYICMHWIVGRSSSEDVLRHWPYLELLPESSKLFTPLFFTVSEQQAFVGTNMHSAMMERRNAWQVEWKQCQAFISAKRVEWGEQFTWIRYLTASTYISSRAFPSTILSPTPSLISTPASYPVLLPGVDALNHARAQPVSWVVTIPPSTSQLPHEPSISLVLHTATPCGSELCNNYGPKPNAELVLGYGFSLPHNPDDTILLKIGGSAAQAIGQTWEVGRGARGAEPVWEAIIEAVSEGPTRTAEDELCAADTLAEMTGNLLLRLPDGRPEGPVRPEILLMLEHYLEGQRDILQSLIHYAQEKEKGALELAQEQGLEFIDEEDETMGPE